MSSVVDEVHDGHASVRVVHVGEVLVAVDQGRRMAFQVEVVLIFLVLLRAANADAGAEISHLVKRKGQTFVPDFFSEYEKSFNLEILFGSGDNSQLLIL